MSTPDEKILAFVDKDYLLFDVLWFHTLFPQGVALLVTLCPWGFGLGDHNLSQVVDQSFN